MPESEFELVGVNPEGKKYWKRKRKRRAKKEKVSSDPGSKKEVSPMYPTEKKPSDDYQLPPGGLPTGDQD